MSLSTQLHRGTLALPMLLLFALLAFAGSEELDASPAPAAQPVAMARAVEPSCHALPLLAQAPADLPRAACPRA